ncbi:unnamed protein product [Ambrosiozyma monospora]|uniref:Unnamed protein product n=1 Tax=Ambrosiozyma monospora TaxID=43982 RepID=A0ACB5UC76_AMBMO|nr:unnamed protein product [Ambrosiozyma monospora]
MGAYTVLDNILAEIIEGLIFDETIFESKQLNKFVDLVLDKQIQIHLQKGFVIKLDELGVKLLCNDCGEYIPMVRFDPKRTDLRLDVQNANSLEFITLLDCYRFPTFNELFDATENLKLMKRLECLKISTSSSLPISLLDEELVQKLIAWRSFCGCDCDADGVCRCKGECDCIDHIKKRVMLSFRLHFM